MWTVGFCVTLDVLTHEIEGARQQLIANGTVDANNNAVGDISPEEIADLDYSPRRTVEAYVKQVEANRKKYQQALATLDGEDWDEDEDEF